MKKMIVALTYLKATHTINITKTAKPPRPKNWSSNFWLHSFSIDLQKKIFQKLILSLDWNLPNKN